MLFFFFKSLFNYEERGQRQAKTSKRTYTHLQLTANVRDCVKIHFNSRWGTNSLAKVKSLAAFTQTLAAVISMS